MKKAEASVRNPSKRSGRPALTPEARENQMIALAIDLAEQQLRDGTASSQIITHYLKLGSTRERLEKEVLEKQKELISAKASHIHAQEENDRKFVEAIEAMRRYSGKDDSDE